ncbi:hybrid sensor histidine kinase/response regulator [Phenylobacterium sp. LjRoot225]|uniref:hybrid sensor histidine kinase/response regulator n=1 Tax=Phenylobacterium sp. LjRoot225 TaxID=3342285 RepID=UPI003ECE011F
MIGADLSQCSMHDLFRVEAESQTQVLTDGLLALERDPTSADHLEACMRAAHSLKGAARIVDIDAAVSLAHAMEDIFVGAQEARIALDQDSIDLLLRGVDLMLSIAASPNLSADPLGERRGQSVAGFVAELAHVLEAPRPPPGKPSDDAWAPSPSPRPRDLNPIEREGAIEKDGPDRALRVTVDNLNRLVGLAGESLVGSRRLHPFGQSMLRLKRLQRDAGRAIESLAEALPPQSLDARIQGAVTEARDRIRECESFLAERLAELEASDRQATGVAHRLYDHALACRMQPLGDGLLGLPRMVRDLARSLGKQARLELDGSTTRIDRDILERLEAPLVHLLRNAVDHGLETPAERLAAGKPAEGVVRLEAHHSAGALQIVVSDDGRGVDLDRLRETVVSRGLAGVETAAKLSEPELLEFLFLPGFTLKQAVTEISGRGVGLDAVQDMLKQVRGTIRVSTTPGAGTRFHLQLPLTLSVVRALLADIGGEPYAFPLAHVVRAVTARRAEIKILEGRQHFDFDGRQVGLVSAHQVLGLAGQPTGDEFSVIVLGDQHDLYGLVVDNFLGGRELVVQPLDPRLGKIRDISAAALTPDGDPVLIVDVQDMVRSMEKLAASDRLNKVRGEADVAGQTLRKRILVADDSLVVRELQRKLLDHHGYEIEVAVDGMDAWATVRGGGFDLVVTDVDMPRMDGVELVRLMRGDPALRSLPVVILSYKDREEDRRRGLEAGADYYLTKGSFQNDALLHAVVDLIGEAAA